MVISLLVKWSYWILNIRVFLGKQLQIMNFSYGKEKLTLKKVFGLAQGKFKGVLTEEVITDVQNSNAIVQKVVGSGKTVYGSTDLTKKLTANPRRWGRRAYRSNTF